MGMDLIDVTFRLEKSFQIDLSQDDLARLLRDQDIVVGDLYELVLTKLHLRDTGRHSLRLNERLWLEIRGVLHTVTCTPLHQIELKTQLEALFPKSRRRSGWDAFRDACPYRVVELDYPPGVRVTGSMLAASVVLIEQLQIWQIAGAKWFWPLLGLLGIWMFSETYLKILAVFAPFRSRFPTGMKNVKDLCRRVLATNYAEICQSTEWPLDQRCVDVWQRFVEILSEALGVEPEEVTFRSRLFRDLGAA